MHRDHAPPDQTAYAAPRHSDSPQARAAPQPGRPVPPECPAVPPSCLSDSPRMRSRHVYQSEDNRIVFTPLLTPSVATSLPDARQYQTIIPVEGTTFPSRATFLIAPSVLTLAQERGSTIYPTITRGRHWEGQPLGSPARELTANKNYTDPHRRRLTGTVSVDKMDALPPATQCDAMAKVRARPYDATATVPVARSDWPVSNARMRARPRRSVARRAPATSYRVYASSFLAVVIGLSPRTLRSGVRLSLSRGLSIFSLFHNDEFKCATLKTSTVIQSIVLFF